MGLKVYIMSDRADEDVEKVLGILDAYHLRLALYRIARGDSFDESVGLAESAQILEVASGECRVGASKRMENYPTIFDYSLSECNGGVETVQLLIPVEGDHPTLLTIDLDRLTVSAEGYD